MPMMTSGLNVFTAEDTSVSSVLIRSNNDVYESLFVKKWNLLFLGREIVSYPKPAGAVIRYSCCGAADWIAPMKLLPIPTPPCARSECASKTILSFFKLLCKVWCVSSSDISLKCLFGQETYIVPIPCVLLPNSLIREKIQSRYLPSF